MPVCCTSCVIAAAGLWGNVTGRSLCCNMVSWQYDILPCMCENIHKTNKMVVSQHTSRQVKPVRQGDSGRMRGGLFCVSVGVLRSTDTVHL